VIGIKQPSLSKLEKQSDMQISTLSKIIKASGAELEARAKFPKVVVTIDRFTVSSAGRSSVTLAGAAVRLRETLPTG
jgi:hypothetical protein